ncbi:hypothetical protein [Flammeovirga kamogawensis]|uniref:Cobalamin adenosyltransferase-like domain-containing protein n=1 Tax=Flammeovirga kamogawensis TaxID=373891 RepID=A0ABX8GZH3_9BACT|nr:hypothetical protein [Flammeovirga kamogawensis]MBB6459457.1 cob(I)alamin adenosyltransferase [Flammeovirga kamogawensis]QWG09010.1 hypothetical protein KM029_08720 [Flammeovirga kamogawensis]TRX67298.1 hypothetical protein EO216_03760 [Flammeovirga kamogawensis]
MSKKVRMCYPYLKETSFKCDFEIETDSLASHIGYAYSKASKYPEMIKELTWLCEMAYHVNGSIRGKLAVTDNDITKAIAIHDKYQELVREETKMFSLPIGCELAGILNLCRSKSKNSTRWAYKIQKFEDVKVDKLVTDLLNTFADIFFVMSVYANKMEDIPTIEFVSKSYDVRFFD